MRQFLLSSMPVLLWIMAALNLLFLVLLVKRWLDRRGDTLPLLMALVSFGLFYDALILSLGTVLPEGGALKSLSLFRFVFHCGLIPLLFPICAMALDAGKKALQTVWIVTAVVMAVGVVAGFVTDLEPRVVEGVVRYAASAATPGWSTGIQNALSYGPILILIVCGVIVWVKKKNPHLFLSGLLMFVFAAIGPAIDKNLIFYISMYGEVFMTLFFYLFVRRREQG